MKKIALLLWLGLIAPMLHAGPLDSLFGDRYTLHYSTQVTATSTYTILVDLSSTTVWPHKETGFIEIGKIKVSIDKIAASTGSIKIGVVTFSSTTAGNVEWFYSNQYEREVSNAKILDTQNFDDDNVIRAKVDSTDPTLNGTTPFIVTNDTLEGSTVIQNDVRLPTMLGGQVFPSPGDIIFTYTKDGANTVTINVLIEYQAIRR